MDSNFNTNKMISKIKTLFPFLALAIVLVSTSCKEDDDVPEENEFFRINVDGLNVELTYQNAVDVSGDNSIFVSGGLHPDDYSITVIADELLSTGTITCAENESSESVRLVIYSGPDRDLTSYDDSNDTCESVITISRNDSYIEGTFTSFVTENSSSNPETLYVTGSFKVREDLD